MTYCRNLLLPAGVPMERQRAMYQVIIYRGEDLPRTDFGIMASLKKAITTSNVAFIDALVKVTFVGHAVSFGTIKAMTYAKYRQYPSMCA